MRYGSLIFNINDFLMIKKYQETDLTYEDYAHKNILDILNENMKEAIIFDMDEIPSGIVQMYSNITARCTSGWEDTFQLVAPCEENLKKNRISIISSLGASVIGLSEEDKVTFGLPGSRMTFEIKKVEQGKEKVKLSISKKDIEQFLPLQTSNLLTLNI